MTTVEDLHDRGIGLCVLAGAGAEIDTTTAGGRPRKMDMAALRLAMHAMADRNTTVHDLAKRLGITTTTLYMHGDGTVEPPGQKLLDAAQDA